MRHLLLAVAMTALLSSGAKEVVAAPPAAQDPATPAFEVASVKPHAGLADGSFVGRQPGGRLAAAAATLRELIEFAYEIQPFQLLNDRKWIDEERWDITAKLPDVAAASGGQAQASLLALRSLLADRFQLVVRKETRPLPIYAIVLARGDGRLGPQLTRSAIDCAALRAAREKGDTTPLPAGAQSCGAQGRIGSIQMRGSPLSAFADRLAERLHRTVVDRTGLTGAWDLTLTYTPEPEQIAAGAVPQGVQPQFDPNGPSFFTAVQEQLGLKLEATTGPVDVLVVERADRARPD